jgi:hypothetical protein
MRHKLTGYVYVDNLNVKIRAEGNHAMAYFAQPSVNKEVVAGRCKNKVVKNVW